MLTNVVSPHPPPSGERGGASVIAYLNNFYNQIAELSTKRNPKDSDKFLYT
jgi:hypothetical protein